MIETGGIERCPICGSRYIWFGMGSAQPAGALLHCMACRAVFDIMRLDNDEEIDKAGGKTCDGD